MIADNRIAELSEVDQDELSRLVAELDAGDYDTGLLGFSDKDIASLLASVEKEQVEEDNLMLAVRWIALQNPTLSLATFISLADIG